MTEWGSYCVREWRCKVWGGEWLPRRTSTTSKGMWVDKPPDKNPAPRTLPVHHHPSYLHSPPPPTWVQLSTRCTHHPFWHSRLTSAALTRTPPLLLPPPVAAVDRQRRRVITTNSSNQSFPPRQKSRLEKTRTQLVSRCVRYTYTGCIIFIALSRKLNSRLGKVYGTLCTIKQIPR